MQQKSTTSRILSLNKPKEITAENLVIKRGHYFKWDEGSGIAHYWFVLNNEHDGKFLIANITSADFGGGKFIDNSCVIAVNQYTFGRISKKSFVNYRGIQLKTVVELKDIILNDSIFENARAPACMIDLMAGVVAIAPNALPRFKTYYKSIGH